MSQSPGLGAGESWAQRRTRIYLAAERVYNAARPPAEAARRHHAAAVAEFQAAIAATDRRIANAEAKTKRYHISPHALSRFVERTAVGPLPSTAATALLRVLIAEEGVAVASRPHWGMSRRRASRLIQVGDWLLLICQPSHRGSTAWDVVTVLVHEEGLTIDQARRRGWIRFAPSRTVPHPGPAPHLPRRPRKPVIAMWLAGRERAAAATRD